MPRNDGTHRHPPRAYSPAARRFHWLTAGFVVVLFVVGEVMTYRGVTLNIWDRLTNNLYSGHKILGFTLLWLVLARLAYRLYHGAPADEPDLHPAQRIAAHVTHWTLYALLLLLPLTGWRGISQYPALDIFGLFNLPAIAAADQAASAQTFIWHARLGKLMLALVLLHVAAALYHHIVRKDSVLRRMLPGLRR